MRACHRAVAREEKKRTVKIWKHESGMMQMNAPSNVLLRLGLHDIRKKKTYNMYFPAIYLYSEIKKQPIGIFTLSRGPVTGSPRTTFCRI